MTKSVTKNAEKPAAKPRGHVEVFAFGDAESVLDRRDILTSIECWSNGRYYQPPINPRDLSRVCAVTSHHRSAISLRKNLLAKHFIPHPWLSRTEFEQFALDALVQANAYLERVDNRMGRPMMLRRALAQQVRRGVEPDQYWWIDDKWQEWTFKAGSIFHFMEHDVAQEIYGVPEYLAALQSAFLNEAATLFRRRYYINGAHAGFIMYATDSKIDDSDMKKIREAMTHARGMGNFKNMLIHSPGGHEKGIQLLPIGEVAAKDEFLGIKNTSRDDVLAAWRTPPQLLGVVPANAGGFGDIEKAEQVFFRNEIEPMMMRMAAVNDWIGAEVIRFTPYVPISGGAAAAGPGGR